jgi:tyrosyl-tRNA synthetase
MTVPILEGLDGVQKMSKSLDNYIAVDDNPRDMFGKTMRVSDPLMLRYYELLTDISVEEMQQLSADLESGKKHPRAVKVELARTLVARFHSAEAADRAVEEFDRIFVNKGLPDEIPVKTIAAGVAIGVCKLMVDVGLASSNGEARRLIEGRAVERDSEKITDAQLRLDLKAGESFVLKAGKKKFVRIQVN